MGVTVDNLFDSKPGISDKTWVSYPYYPTRWFNALGRSLFVDLNVKFGGEKN